MDETGWTTKTPPATAPNAARSAGAESQPETRDGLRMSREEMTELARRTVEHLVERVDGLGDDQAWDGDFQRALEDKLLEAPPEDGHPAAEVIDRAIRDILPFSMRLDHPRFFGLIPSSPTWPGVLADFMAAAYNVNVASWLTASGPSAVELVVIDWIRGWLGYPEGAGGLFTSGGSAASLEGLVAAREAAGHPERGTVYMSEQDLYEVNKTVLAPVFWDDPAFITSTTLNGMLSLRLCIMNHSTTWNDVRETLESIEKSGVDALAVHEK